jgi:hypothetical protein
MILICIAVLVASAIWFCLCAKRPLSAFSAFVALVLLIGIFCGCHFVRMELAVPFDTNAAEERNLKSVCQHLVDHQLKHGKLPVNSDITVLTRALDEEQEEALKARPGEVLFSSANGQLVDYWGTPIRISFTDPMDPVAYSAGKDKKWDTPDDLVVDSNTPIGAYSDNADEAK